MWCNIVSLAIREMLQLLFAKVAGWVAVLRSILLLELEAEAETKMPSPVKMHVEIKKLYLTSHIDTFMPYEGLLYEKDRDATGGSVHQPLSLASLFSVMAW